MYRKQTFLAIMKQIEIHRKCCTYFVNESNIKQWNVTRFLNKIALKLRWQKFRFTWNFFFFLYSSFCIYFFLFFVSFPVSRKLILSLISTIENERKKERKKKKRVNFNVFNACACFVCLEALEKFIFLNN